MRVARSSSGRSFAADELLSPNSHWKRFTMRRTALLIAPFIALLACDSGGSPVAPDDVSAQLSKTAKGGRAATAGVVYVTSQGLYYDTFVAAESLPMRGRFQKIENGETEFGPGQPGYLGGRWWEDLNGNGIQDAGDHFFLCPLLGPGRQNP
jgi:hypothetical protein